VVKGGFVVAGRDLRALFGSNDMEIDAPEAFTDREAQWQAVTTALTSDG
jgi:hypothetical protein